MTQVEIKCTHSLESPLPMLVMDVTSKLPAADLSDDRLPPANYVIYSWWTFAA